MADQKLTFSVDCATIWDTYNNGNDTLDSPGWLSHTGNNGQVVLYVNYILQSDVQTPVQIALGDDVSINAVNRSEQDNYKCAVVRFNAMNFNSNQITLDMMNNDDTAPIDLPEFISLPATLPYLDYNPSSSQTGTGWVRNTIDYGGNPVGVMTTRDALVKSSGLRVPSIKFTALNRGLMQYRVEIAVSYQGSAPRYYSFDPFLQIG